MILRRCCAYFARARHAHGALTLTELGRGVHSVHRGRDVGPLVVFPVATHRAAAASASGGAGTCQGAEEVSAPTILSWRRPSYAQRVLTSARLLLEWPWRRVRTGAYLEILLEGDVAEKQPRWLRSKLPPSLPSVTEALRKASHDPRIRGALLRIEPLKVGWARVQEIRKYVEYFRASGKDAVAYVERGGEKEYYLACACAEVVVPPLGMLWLKGLCIAQPYLKGAMDKLGIEPDVRAAGKYKTAAEALVRSDLSDAQREQLSALLDDVYDTFLAGVAAGRSKAREDVEALVDGGVFDMAALLDGGWVDRVAYLDELRDALRVASGVARPRRSERDPAFVPLSKYSSVPASLFGLRGRKTVAVLRATGIIVPGTKPNPGQIRAEPFIKEIERLARQRNVAGLVVRIDSRGGDALASDVMWRAIRRAAGDKPLVATMGDVAASGGYYMAMAAPTVVAQPLTITGSIGVVAPKLTTMGLYDKLGITKDPVSRGRFAELFLETVRLEGAASERFDAFISHIYGRFTERAAESRGMAVAELEARAQGRVWSGKRAREQGLVDHLGGVDTAVALVKEKAGIPAGEHVTLREVSSERLSLRSLISSGAAIAELRAALGSVMPFLGLMQRSNLEPGSQSLLGPVTSSLDALHLAPLLRRQMGSADADQAEEAGAAAPAFIMPAIRL